MKTSTQLEKDLYAIDNTLLVRAGETINKKLLNKIAGLAGKIRYVPIKETRLEKDLIKSFNDTRYVNILYPPEINLKVINYINHIKIPEKIMFELEHMKEISPYTYHHIMIIAILAGKISFDHSIRYKYSPDKAILLSLFHDIGKSRIPLSILDKRTPVTQEERRILTTHPLIGYVLLHYYFGKDHKKYDFSSFQHHERLDGSGYPLGIKKANKYSQLIGVVDTLDALISERPYRSTPYSLRAAIDLLLEEADKGRFNKSLVRTLIIYSRRETPGTKIIIGQRGRDSAPADNSYGKTATS
ncbi:MAG: HD domain-containing protein [Syntrophaceae bacterium]|nr:HD domain-containing protein [Syntrophaceae bacterium]